MAMDEHTILLDYLVDITAQRDAELLEISLLRTMTECFDVKRVQLCMVHFDSREIYRLREALADGTVSDGDDTAIAALTEALGHTFQREAESHRAETIELGTDSILVYPLFILNVNIGFVLLYYDAGMRMDLQLLTSFMKVYGNYVTLLVDSQRDSLTGLMNRKTFDDKILGVIDYKRRREAGLFTRDQQRRLAELKDDFWLGIFDIDNFKTINDQYGHLYGDEVLILIGQIMRENFRNSDIMIRYGGEEFIVIIRAHDDEEALRVFDRFRETVAKHRFSRIGTITVSIGVRQILQGEPPTVIVGHADQALYYAKKSGKNKVCLYHRLVKQGLLKEEIAEGEVHYL